MQTDRCKAFFWGRILFCYELTDPMLPVELRRYVWTEDPELLYFDNQGQAHVFLYPKSDRHWDLIVARSDTDSESAHLYRVYSGFAKIDYLAKNLSIRQDENGEPEVRMTSPKELRIHLADDGELIINIAR